MRACVRVCVCVCVCVFIRLVFVYLFIYLFCFVSELLWFALYRLRPEKELARDVFDNCSTLFLTSLILSAQNSSTHDRIFATFRSVFNKRGQKSGGGGGGGRGSVACK